MSHPWRPRACPGPAPLYVFDAPADTKGECVLRIEAIAHNTKELPRSRPLEKFPLVAERMSGMVDGFMNALHAIDACFIVDDTLEQLPIPAQVGKPRWEASIATKFAPGA